MPVVSSFQMNNTTNFVTYTIYTVDCIGDCNTEYKVQTITFIVIFTLLFLCTYCNGPQ